MAASDDDCAWTAGSRASETSSVTNALDFDAVTRDLQQLVDALAAIEQDADFGPMFAGVWLEDTAEPRAVLALKLSPGTKDMIAAARTRYEVLADPQCRVVTVRYSLADLMMLRARFQAALEARDDLRSMVVASGVALQANQFWISVLQFASPTDCAAVRDEFGGDAALITTSSTRWSTERHQLRRSTASGDLI